MQNVSWCLVSNLDIYNYALPLQNDSYRSFPRCRCDFPRLRLSIGFLDYIKPSTLEIYTNDRRDIFLNNGVCIFDQFIVIFWLWSKIASDGRQRKFERSDGQGKWEVSSVEEGTGALPGLPRGFWPFPWGQRWFLLRALRFFLHQNTAGLPAFTEWIAWVL